MSGHLSSTRLIPVRGDAQRARSAWLANARQELLTPVRAIQEAIASLLPEAQANGPAPLIADLGKIKTAADTLLTLLEELLDPAGEANGLLDREKRHQLRTPLNPILGYCELWTEDEPLLPPHFHAELRKVHGLAKGLLTQLANLGKMAKVASGADIDLDADGPAPMIQEVVKSLPPLEGNHRKTAEKGHILIADDNEANRDLLGRWLRNDGHTIEEAADGQEALELARKGACDLILLDIIMPRVNGFEALASLKADPCLAHVPVVMISAFDDVDSAVRCIEQGAEDYLPKPCDPVLLKARVGACLEKKRLRDQERLFTEEIERQRRRSDELLHGILPAEVIDELKATGTVKPRRFEEVAVFFCDLVNFTPFCDRHPPEWVVQCLQELIEQWERIARAHHVEKIKTIGDSFMAAAGLLRPTKDHPVLHAIRCGQAMIEATRAMATDWDLRVGIHWGPVIAGVIGRQQYLFDLWGDTVNTAARMESHGIPGHVVLSAAAWQHVAHRCRGESRGLIAIKGKGQMEVVRVVDCPA
jgi:class 3 adenylate cyclase